MKLKTVLSVFLLFLSLQARTLDVGISYAVFATPEKAYLEVNLEIAAASVNYVTQADTQLMKASVEVLIMVRDGDRVVNYEKYVLNSPEVKSPQSILDVKRMMVPNGAYLLEVTVQDLNDAENRSRFQRDLEVKIDTEPYLTDLILLRDFKKDASESPFTKNGFYLEPLPFGFYDRAALTLAFYAEVYHSQKAVNAPHYTVRCTIDKELGNDNTELVSTVTQNKRPTTIDALLIPLDISQLPSGNYSLSVELRTSTGEVFLSRKVYFQRSNPFLEVQEVELTEEVMEKQFTQALTEEQLRYALRAISPLAKADESETLKNILSGTPDAKAMRFFLFRHFIRINPNNPESAYNDYMRVARMVDEKFHSGFRYGFETDRGMIFLRYGSPDDMVHVEDDPAAPPYQIWIYYNFPKTNQKNVKFLFYNPTLAGEEFIILHSTARGEINNPRWERDLYARNAGEQYDGDNYHDATRMQSNQVRLARTYFEDY